VTAVDLALYRSNVGVVLFNAQGLAWMGRRSPGHGQEDHAQFVWQFPQGGVDPGEPLEAAARRELQEETGVVSASQLACTTEWLPYDFPAEAAKRGKWRGQKQVWYAFRFEGEETEIRLDVQSPPEFVEWRWARLEEAPDLIVPFKRGVYRHVVEAFGRFARP
jgi:putative (di)nucleoside polyphosphate hydrolase